MELYRVPIGPAEPFMRREGSDFIKAFATSDGLRILCSVDTGPHGRLLHVSISRADRHPSWDEIKACKQEFFGDRLDAIMVFPRSELWVNAHPNTFHLWQLPRIPGESGRWELM